MAGYGSIAEEGDEETTPLIGKGFLEQYSNVRDSTAWVKLVDPKSRLGLRGARNPQDDPSLANQLAQESHARGEPATGRSSRSTSKGVVRSGSSRSFGAHRSFSSRSASRSLSRQFGAKSRDRLASRNRRGSVESTFSTVGFSPGPQPGSLDQAGTLRSLPSRTFQDKEPRADKFRETLLHIRKTDGSEDILEEEAIPCMPKGSKGFHSTAHLRTEDYWSELLGHHSASVGPCKWVEDRRFDALVAIAVIVNAVLVGLDNSESPSWFWWAMQYPLILGLLEIAARLLRWRRGLRPRDAESMVVQVLDAILVVGIASLVWGQKLVKVLHVSVGDGPDFFVCLLSLLRLARLVHIVPGLHELARGIVDALQGLFWVLVLMSLVLYAVAILCTRLIGHAELGGGDESEDAIDARGEFSSVGTSMFLLFQVTSAWSLQPLLPLFEVSTSWQVFFSLFYIFCGWMLLAVMTGTVSFTMIAMRARIVGEDLAREEERRNMATEHILQIFRDFDEDGSGDISHDELMRVCRSKEIQNLLKTHTNIQTSDLLELFTWMDEDKSGAVSFAEFSSSFRWLNDSFKTQNLLRLREKVTKDMKQQLRRMQAVVASSFDVLTKEVAAPVKKLHALSEQVQLAHCHAVETSRTHDAPRAIAELEQRVGEQVDAIVARAEKLAAARWGEQKGGLHRGMTQLSLEEGDGMRRVQSLKCGNLEGLVARASVDSPDSSASPESEVVPIRHVPSIKAHFDLGDSMSEGSSRSEGSSPAPIAASSSIKVRMDLGEVSSAGSSRSQQSAAPMQAVASMKSTLELLAETSSLGSGASKKSSGSVVREPVQRARVTLGSISSSASGASPSSRSAASDAKPVARATRTSSSLSRRGG